MKRNIMNNKAKTIVSLAVICAALISGFVAFMGLFELKEMRNEELDGNALSESILSSENGNEYSVYYGGAILSEYGVNEAKGISSLSTLYSDMMPEAASNNMGRFIGMMICALSLGLIITLLSEFIYDERIMRRPSNDASFSASYSFAYANGDVRENMFKNERGYSSLDRAYNIKSSPFKLKEKLKTEHYLSRYRGSPGNAGMYG